MIIHHDQVGFTSGMQRWFNMQIIKHNTAYYQKQRQKPNEYLIRCRKCLLQNSTSFHDKSSDEIRNRRNEPQHKKGYIQQAYHKHHAKWGKTEAISSKVRNETRVSTLSTLIQQSVGIPSQSIKQEEEMKGIQIGRRNERNSNRKSNYP
jgi:hypothetical protein